MPTVSADDLVQGTTKFLKAQPTIVALVGAHTDDALSPYIYQYEMIGNIEADPGKAAIVVIDGGGWGVPNPHNTIRFRRIGIEMWISPNRDGQNNVISNPETKRRGNQLYAEIDRIMFRPYSKVVMFGSIRTSICDRIGEVDWEDEPDGNGLIKGTAFYGVGFG